MQDTAGIPRQPSRESPHRTPGDHGYRAALTFLLFLFVFFATPFFLAAESEHSSEREDQSVAKGTEVVEIDLRQEQIERLAGKILEEMRKGDTATPDTLFLKSGIKLNCTILSEAASHYTISANGLKTIFPKSKVMRVESRPQEIVEKDLRAMALEKATRIIDFGLVPHGDEWIMPDEKAYRVMKTQMRAEAKRIEARARAEIAKFEDNEALEKLDGGIRAPIAMEGDYGTRMYVEVTLVGKNSSTDVIMLLDTGAGKTLIPPDAADELELVKIRDVRVRVADGTPFSLPLVRLEEMSVHGAVVRDMDVIVAAFDPPYVIGLLGSDFFGHFESRIDPDEGVLILKLRQNDRRSEQHSQKQN